MRKRILVAVDGSEISEETLLHLPNVAEPAETELTLAMVCTGACRLDRATLAALRDRTAAVFPHANMAFLHGDVTHALLTCAAETSAEMIALTTHGRSGLKRLFLGSTAVALMRRSALPLFVVRPGIPARKVQRILVPLDGSPLSERILPAVEAVAAGTKASVLILTVSPDADRVLNLSEYLHEKAMQLNAKGVSAGILLRSGPPAEAIQDAFAEERIDLVALTTHGRSGWNRFKFGSVAESLLEGAPVPMIVQRAAEVPKPGAASDRAPSPHSLPEESVQL